jgi:hypothetical protein
MHNFFRGKKLPKSSGNFYNLKKLPKENDRPKGENSPNLVTLSFAHFGC